MVISSRRFAFDPSWIKAFKERARHVFRTNIQPVQILHMAIDPSGGGTGSDYAILTGCMEDSRAVVNILTMTHIPLPEYIHCHSQRPRNTRTAMFIQHIFITFIDP